ncbi:TonB-dependent receptor [Nibrella viscosa]|uniref:TonB-dependent receptor n=1 Tax=Nibrella viscosa TaxID=1084524 RepID=A0ABP8KWK6_9BACT
MAQERTVTGKVTSAEDNTSLPGVTVQIKGTNRGTTSNGEGVYTLTNVPDNATLIFSFIGLATQEVAVGNRSTVDVALTSDTKALEEVVVVGYGTAKRKDVTGSVVQVSAKDFNPGINPNPLQAIQGKVAGLVITRPSGDPNQNPTVRLRGYTSLAGGSDPLYVVDGMIGVPINTIAPEDIESMDVLKDASAAAIYGSRAANGVIIVTTKRGKSGRTQVSFNNYVGVETIARRLDLLDGPGYREAVRAIKGDASLSDQQRFPTGNFDTDWIKEITRTAITNNHDLSVAGGSQGFSYRGSLNYINQQGTVKNTGFNRLTGRINLDQKALDNRLNIAYNLSVQSRESKLADWGIIGRAVTFLPTLPVRNADGSYYEIPGSFDLFNPVAMLENQNFDQTNRQIIGGMNVRYEVLDGLTLGVNGQYRNENNVTSRFRARDIKAYAGEIRGAERNLNTTNDRLLELTANYTRGFGENNSNFTVLGGYSYQQVDFDGFGAYNSQFLTNAISYNNLGLGAGSLTSPRSDYANSYRNQLKLASFFGRATVNLGDKYNFTATLRRDGSSKLGANNKWGLFPSLAAGWTLTNESFFPKGNVLNFLKLRAGWGQTGNTEGISPYQSLQLYGPRGTYYNGSIGDFLPGYGIIQNANPNLKWEVVEQTNIGLDFQLFNSRLTGTLEVYNKLTRDMLYNYTVPADGVRYFTDRIAANVGSMRNQGIELSIGGDVIASENFVWTSRLVGSLNRNEIVTLRNDDFDSGIVRFNAFGGRGLSDVFASIIYPGSPLGTFNNVPTFVGFSSDGKVLLAPGSGDQPVTEVSRADAAARFAAGNPLNQGNPQPFLTGALINSFRYGNFDLNFQIRGVFGNKILNNLRSNLMIPGSILETNMLRDVRTLPTNYSTNVLSTYWLESGSFARLDNWQIGYNLPVRGSKYFTNARVYAGGNNLFILTAYKGVDPELQVRGNLGEGGRGRAPESIGMDAGGIYPRTRAFQLGLNLSF